MRVGKRDLFSNEVEGRSQKILHPFKFFTGTPALLDDEGLHFGRSFEYKAFDISLKQLTEIYRLISAIQSTQRNSKILQSQIKGIILKKTKLCENFNSNENKIYVREGKLPWIVNHRIQGYVDENDLLDAYLNIGAKLPEKTEDNTFIFRKENLNSPTYNRITENWPASSKKSLPDCGSSQLKMGNSCRATALKILESILGTGHGISEESLVSPGYSSERVGENDPFPFYRLPPPPSSLYNETPEKKRILTS